MMNTPGYCSQWNCLAASAAWVNDFDALAAATGWGYSYQHPESSESPDVVMFSPGSSGHCVACGGIMNSMDGYQADHHWNMPFQPLCGYDLQGGSNGRQL